MKILIVTVTITILVIAVVFHFYNQKDINSILGNNPSSTNSPEIKSDDNQISFDNPKKSAHYESNTPSHGSILAGVPVNVVIDFNFDLAKPSEISIIKDGVGGLEYGIGEIVIDSNKLSMRREMDPTAPDSKYTVFYKACWPDGSCHDGNFQFAIDRSLGEGFINSLDKKEVEIKLSEVMFEPKNIRISKGTKITWINDDNVEHYVNTDSHPAHTYYQEQNSKVLKRGDSYSVTFDTAGIYPYHCSAHADTMVGTILVE